MMIFAFNLFGHPGEKAVRAVAQMENIAVKDVPPSSFATPLSLLAAPSCSMGYGGMGQPAAQSGSFSDTMLVFAGMDRKQISRFVDLVNASGAPRIALKAMMTPTNASWTAEQLREELEKEHQYFQNLRNNNKQ